MGKVIGIDPGHQLHADSKSEPVAPGSSKTKKRVSSGTQGLWSRVPEHEVNLAVALMLRDMLTEAGATVVMTRETGDVNISNKERAELFNSKNVDMAIRLHCNGSENKSKHGAFVLIPPRSHTCFAESERMARLVLAAYGEITGLSTHAGIIERSDQTGFNWCNRPIINLEMGHMTNKSDDLKLSDAAFQEVMARGIFKGIELCFQ